MSTTAHPPKRWKKRRSSLGGYEIVASAPQSDADREQIATCKTKADAMLIESAPDLLEACKAALAERFGGDDPCVDLDPTTNKLRAAISKATGQ